MGIIDIKAPLSLRPNSQRAILHNALQQASRVPGGPRENIPGSTKTHIGAYRIPGTPILISETGKYLHDSIKNPTGGSSMDNRSALKIVEKTYKV